MGINSEMAEIKFQLNVSGWGAETIRIETDYTLEQVKELATECHSKEDLSAKLSSGSFPVKGMIIAPCSMKTLSGIATGYTDNLIIRAADVSIKEQRKLILLCRETPLSAIHLENMLKLARLGVIILPPVPAFYSHPQDLDDIINHTVGRTLDHFGVDHSLVDRWKAEAGEDGEKNDKLN